MFGFVRQGSAISTPAADTSGSTPLQWDCPMPARPLTLRELLLQDEGLGGSRERVGARDVLQRGLSHADSVHCVRDVHCQCNTVPIQDDCYWTSDYLDAFHVYRA